MSFHEGQCSRNPGTMVLTDTGPQDRSPEKGSMNEQVVGSRKIQNESVYMDEGSTETDLFTDGTGLGGSSRECTIACRLASAWVRWMGCYSCSS